MQIQIGFRNNASEMTLEVDLTQSQLEALASASQESPQTLSDKSGRTLIIPAASLAYVLVNPQKPQQVGFGVG